MNETKGYKVLVIGSEPEIGELIEFILARGRNDEVKFALGGRERGDTYYPPLPEEPELPSVDERAGG